MSLPEEVAPGIHRIESPLPGNPLRAINAYLVRGRDRSLLVDTGMNRPECAAALEGGLAALGVDRERLDLCITHCHSDHVGLVSRLAAPSSRIYLHPSDAALILDPALWTALAAGAAAHGFPGAEAAVLSHPGKRYLFSGRPAFTALREGEGLDYGPYGFRAVETPGHTPGHLCLHEPTARLLLSGDHVLAGITPNISAWGQEADPLGDFLASLDKVAALDVRLVLPGHRMPLADLRGRIGQLRAHHRARMEEVLAILARGEQTAYQVASRMRWEIRCPRWEEFPVPQQWFATGEALAHLVHLERTGKITRDERDGTTHFSLASGSSSGTSELRGIEA